MLKADIVVYCREPKQLLVCSKAEGYKNRKIWRVMKHGLSKQCIHQNEVKIVITVSHVYFSNLLFKSLVLVVYGLRYLHN